MSSHPSGLSPREGDTTTEILKKRKKSIDDDNNTEKNDIVENTKVNVGLQRQQPVTKKSKKNKGSSGTNDLFPIGDNAKVELKRALLGRGNNPPATRIINFQKEHSLHSMMAKAFGTTPKHVIAQQLQQSQQSTTTESTDDKDKTSASISNSSSKAIIPVQVPVVEQLNTDSVMTFLHHLGVRQYDVHKRISDAILKNLELEIKKTTNHDALLQLLKNCWDYTAATSSTQLEIRPILWAVLRQLGTQTPTPVLLALAERVSQSSSSSSSSSSSTTNPQNDEIEITKSNRQVLKSQSSALAIMKHADVFRPLPSSLKRLVWEADWDNIVSGIAIGSGTAEDQQLLLQQKQQWQQYQQGLLDAAGPETEDLTTLKLNPTIVYKKAVESTLLFHTVAPYVQQYIVTTKALVDNANRAYVSTLSERRVLTSNRRALTKISGTGGIISSSTTTTSGGGNSGSVPSTTTTSTTTTTTFTTSTLLRQAAGATVGGGSTTETTTTTTAAQVSVSTETSGKAISHIRSLLCDTVGTASSYRPKLLFSLLSMLIAHHGGNRLQFGILPNDKTNSSKIKKEIQTAASDADAKFTEDGDMELEDELENIIDEHGMDNNLVVCGARNLHCTLVADILLSAGGPLPKAYTHVVSLAQILDECVQEGNVSDTNVCKIQAILKLIFQPENKTTDDNAVDNRAAAADSTSPSKKVHKKSSINEIVAPRDFNDIAVLTKEQQRVLNKHIRNGLEEMKKCDAQNLFLNPVTDDIAPGYSKIIANPMCISMMEQNVIKNKYNSIEEWENDVKLMYTNCIDYNQGPTGQWFRGEANRQCKIFKERIVPKLRRQHQTDKARQQKRNPASNKTPVDAPFAQIRTKGPINTAVLKTSTNDIDNAKRTTASATTIKEVVVPLQPSSKRRKKEKESFIPSMPALASMLLADPFVVRIFVARILRDLRAGVMVGNGLPLSHNSIPSSLQILYLSQWSKQVCSIWGRKFIVPATGLEQYDDDDVDTAVRIPYLSLRKCLPVLVRLLIEADLDTRTSIKGDLFAASQSTPIQLPPIVPDVWTKPDDTIHLQISLSLVKGSLIHLCQTGNSNELSLHVTFPKFASVICESSKATKEAATTLLYDNVFFNCLVVAILRHKTKLPKETRDAIIESWISWLQVGHVGSSVDDAMTDQVGNDVVKIGCMTSNAHERLMFLLNEWHALSGAYMPRDKLVEYATRIVHVSNESEIDKYRRFDRLWNFNEHYQKKKKKKLTKYLSSRYEFILIKCQYERMMKGLSETNVQQWKENVKISNPDAKLNESNDQPIDEAIAT